MQQFSVFKTKHISHGTPPMRGELKVLGWGIEFFRRGVLPLWGG